MRQILALLFLAIIIFISCKIGFRTKEKQLNMESETKNLTIAAVDRFNAAFNKHDVDAVMKAMTEDCIF